MTPTAAAYTITAAALLAAVVILRRQQDSGAGDSAAYDMADGYNFGADNAYLPPAEDTMPDQTTNVFQAAIVQASTAAQSLGESVGLTSAPDASTASRNEKAFLDMIAYSEGTAAPDGYRYMFGAPKIAGRIASNLDDHPHQYFSFQDKTGAWFKTSAAGRYQFLARTWDELKSKLSLPDFGPDSQDRAALELIRQRGALKDVQAGRITAAITKCAPIWASMPGAGYNQPERKLTSLLASFSQAGGNLEA